LRAPGLGNTVLVVHATHLGTWVVLARLAGATGLGMLLGIDRELDGHEAGIRTHALLALGSALFGAISVGAFGAYVVASKSATNVTVDVSRVASYVAAGVGFLGAGTILKKGDRVKGLTTAASLWVTAAVGLAAGLGFWPGAVAAALLAFAGLVSERPVKWLRARSRVSENGSAPTQGQ